MLRNLYICLCLSFLLLVSACSRWLEIEPKAEIAAEVLFETPEGFSIALNGIYTHISAPALYGREWKYAFVDVLARCYDLNKTGYDQLIHYDYVSAGMDQKISDMWSGAFHAIANCNALLEQLEGKDPTFFKESERSMLEGEVRSLRAMLYFDLLRLFAPAPKVGDV